MCPGNFPLTAKTTTLSSATTGPCRAQAASPSESPSHSQPIGRHMVEATARNGRKAFLTLTRRCHQQPLAPASPPAPVPPASSRPHRTAKPPAQRPEPRPRAVPARPGRRSRRSPVHAGRPRVWRGVGPDVRKCGRTRRWRHVGRRGAAAGRNRRPGLQRPVPCVAGRQQQAMHMTCSQSATSPCLRCTH